MTKDKRFVLEDLMIIDNLYKGNYNLELIVKLCKRAELVKASKDDEATQ
jgi:hypothetical protein